MLVGESLLNPSSHTYCSLGRETLIPSLAVGTLHQAQSRELMKPLVCDSPASITMRDGGV